MPVSTLSHDPLADKRFRSKQIPACLGFGVKKNAHDPANVTRLLVGETKFSLIT